MRRMWKNDQRGMSGGENMIQKSRKERNGEKVNMNEEEEEEKTKEEVNRQERSERGKEKRRKIKERGEKHERVRMG